MGHEPPQDHPRQAQAALTQELLHVAAAHGPLPATASANSEPQHIQRGAVGLQQGDQRVHGQSVHAQPLQAAQWQYSEDGRMFVQGTVIANDTQLPQPGHGVHHPKVLLAELQD